MEFHGSFMEVPWRCRAIATAYLLSVTIRQSEFLNQRQINISSKVRERWKA